MYFTSHRNKTVCPSVVNTRANHEASKTYITPDVVLFCVDVPMCCVDVTLCSVFSPRRHPVLYGVI